MSDCFSEAENLKIGLYKDVQLELKKWSALNASYINMRRKRKRSSRVKDFHDHGIKDDLLSEQKVLLLEAILEWPSKQIIHSKTLAAMDKVYQFERKGNADVLHRWCEIIVACCDVSRLAVVRNFLINHQAMGIYLYGELAISDKAKFRRLGVTVFQALTEEMDKDLSVNVQEMIFSKDAPSQAST